MEAEGQPTEEPPADARPDVNQILGAVVPAPSVLAPIPEEGDHGYHDVRNCRIGSRDTVAST